MAAADAGVAAGTAVGYVGWLMDRLTHVRGGRTARLGYKYPGGCPRAGPRAARAVRSLRVPIRVTI